MEFVIIVAVAFLVYRYFLGEAIRKSAVAACIQSLLKQIEALAYGGRFIGSIEKAGQDYTEMAWDASPADFEGVNGRPPHKVTAAVYALALAAKRLTKQKDVNAEFVTFALGKALIDVARNTNNIPMTAVDHRMMEYAVSVYRKLAGELI